MKHCPPQLRQRGLPAHPLRRFRCRKPGLHPAGVRYIRLAIEHHRRQRDAGTVLGDQSVTEHRTEPAADRRKHLPGHDPVHVGTRCRSRGTANPWPTAKIRPPPTQSGWMAWDVTASVQGWVSGTLTNYGLQLRIYDPGVAVANFQARPHNFAPRLTIYYEPLPPVCDPVTTVRINGPTTGDTGMTYTFEARIRPSMMPPPHSPTRGRRPIKARSPSSPATRRTASSSTGLPRAPKR